MTTATASVKSIDGPRGYPLVGSLFDLLRNPLGFAAQTRQQYGDLAAFKVGPVPIYFVSHPDHIKHILQDNRQNYTKGAMWMTLRRVFSNGLLASEGDFWLRQRRLMQPAFHRQRLANLTTLMVNSIAEMLERWQQHAQSGKTFDLSREMTETTLRILLNTLFSRGLTEEEIHILDDNFREALALVNRRLWLFFLPERIPVPGDARFRRAIQAIDRVVYRVIEERRQSGEESDDLLSMLLAVQDEDTGEKMTDQQLRDEVFTIFLAGHETAALTLTWLWYLLSQHPEAALQAQQEVDEVLAGRTPTFADLPQLKKLHMIVEETMRLYPIGWIIPRAIEKDDLIDGYQLKAGAMLLICTYTLHRNPLFWENPNQFEPERFGPDRTVNRYAFMPFGAGPRQCIGNNFAIMEMQLLVSMVLQKFRVTITNAAEVKPKALPTLQPDRSLMARIEAR